MKRASGKEQFDAASASPAKLSESQLFHQGIITQPFCKDSGRMQFLNTPCIAGDWGDSYCVGQTRLRECSLTHGLPSLYFRGAMCAVFPLPLICHWFLERVLSAVCCTHRIVCLERSENRENIELLVYSLGGRGRNGRHSRIRIPCRIRGDRQCGVQSCQPDHHIERC